MSTAQVVEDIVETNANVAFYYSEEFWVSVAFVLVVVGLFIPVSKKVVSLLQNRINRIKKELQDAENLKLEAQELYAKYERSLMHIDDENYGENEIVEVFQKGYTFGERVIRYAMVKVANWR